jgi:hypothetical protein
MQVKNKKVKVKKAYFSKLIAESYLQEKLQLNDFGANLINHGLLLPFYLA